MGRVMTVSLKASITILQKKKKNWILVFKSILWVFSYFSTLLSLPKVPIVMSLVLWTVYLKKQQVFLLEMHKRFYSIFASPPITLQKVTGRASQYRIRIGLEHFLSCTLSPKLFACSVNSLLKKYGCIIHFLLIVCVLLALAPVNKHCFRPVWYVGQKALFLTRALLFPLPTWVDYRLYWNTPEKRSKRRWKSWNCSWEACHSHLGKGKKKERKKKRNRHCHVSSKQPTVRKFPFAQDTFYIFGKDFIWFWLNNYRVFSWESFNVKLDGKPELSTFLTFQSLDFSDCFKTSYHCTPFDRV